MLNVAGAILAAFAFLLSTTVTTVGGVVPVPILAPLLVIAFALRAGGISYAISRGRAVMPWATRVASWVFFGGAVLLLGVSGSKYVVAILAAFLVLDFAAGWSKRELHEKEKATKEKRRVAYRRAALIAAAIGYAAFVVAFQVFYARYLPQGAAITWTLIALGFAFALRLWLVGPKASDPWLFAPADHKRHQRREARVVDPKRARAEEVLDAFRARGDAAPFLQFVRDSATAADLPADDVRALESRILASFARAGTNRDADVRAALDEIERILSLRRPQENRP
jgi:thiamine transporter ThiT